MNNHRVATSTRPTIRTSPFSEEGETGILGRIAPVGSSATGIKLCVYGRGKTGKTRLACSFPKPLLLIGTEDGTKSVSNIPGVDFIRVATGSELTELVEYVSEGGLSYWKLQSKAWAKQTSRTGDSYAGVCLDTAGGFQDIILKDVLGLDEVPVSKFRKAAKGESWGITDKANWGVIGTQFKERINGLIRLADTLGTNVVVIAHERNFTSDEAAVSDVMLPSVGAALTPSVAGWLNGACDYICQTYIRQEQEVVETKIGDKTVQTWKPTGGIEYCLRIGQHPVYMTGFRVPDGVELPESIVDPSYNKLERLIRGA